MGDPAQISIEHTLDDQKLIIHVSREALQSLAGMHFYGTKEWIHWWGRETLEPLDYLWAEALQPYNITPENQNASTTGSETAGP